MVICFCANQWHLQSLLIHLVCCGLCCGEFWVVFVVLSHGSIMNLGVEWNGARRCASLFENGTDVREIVRVPYVTWRDSTTRENCHHPQLFLSKRNDTIRHLPIQITLQSCRLYTVQRLNSKWQRIDVDIVSVVVDCVWMALLHVLYVSSKQLKRIRSRSPYLLPPSFP